VWETGISKISPALFEGEKKVTSSIRLILKNFSREDVRREFPTNSIFSSPSFIKPRAKTSAAASFSTSGAME
jgi:hypothetical protein